MTKGYNVLDDLQDHLIAKLAELGYDEVTVKATGQRIREHFRRHWGGQTIYFQKTRDTKQRDNAIYDQYDGTNKEYIIREFDICDQMLYRILKRVRAERITQNPIPLKA